VLYIYIYLNCDFFLPYNTVYILTDYIITIIMMIVIITIIITITIMITIIMVIVMISIIIIIIVIMIKIFFFFYDYSINSIMSMCEIINTIRENMTFVIESV